MTKRTLGLLVPLVACASSSSSDALATGGDATVGITGMGATSGGSSGTETGSSSSALAEPGESSSSEGGIKYDVGTGGYCAQRSAGIYCDGTTSKECNDAGLLVDEAECAPDLCVEGSGCVVCVAGEFHCQGAKVMACDTAVQPPAWTPIDTCNPAASEGCDRTTGTCEVLQPVGSNVPTGVYYQFADFRTATSEFKGGYDVDGWDDRLYVVRNATSIDVYQLGLLDSDGDGVFEPNQHPDNPDEPGELEIRSLTFLETIATPHSAAPNGNELLVLEDRLYLGGLKISESIFNGATSVFSMKPTWLGRFSHLGYDDQRGMLYASNEQRRRVLQHDATDDTWGIAFVYPTLAGAHMDGMEVVTDPETGIAYVYVSDMTSDFIGQYRLDREEGWVQENLFAYDGTTGSLVEGMGFGPLHHFWATGGSALYEVGGGDLAEYTEPPG